MGKHIHTSTAYREQIENILQADKSDLIIIFSYTGSYFSSVSLRAKEQHLLLPKIWMVCGEGSTTDWFVDETLTFASDAKREAHPFLLETAASFIANEYAVLYQ